MKAATRKRLAAIEREMIVEKGRRAALEMLRRLYDLTDEQVQELRAAPDWAVEAVMARIEKREPSGVGIHVAWRSCSCAPCTGTRKLLGPTENACPICFVEPGVHVVGSRPHDQRRWLGERLETLAEAAEHGGNGGRA